MAQKSENSRKIAAKISEGMQGNGIFRNSYKIDAVRVRVTQNKKCNMTQRCQD
jgi:hypothetical protein